MNLSLIILVIMVVAVIPFLVTRFWISLPKKNPVLFEDKSEKSSAVKPERNPQAILDCLSMNLEPKELLGIKQYSVAVVAEDGKKFLGFDLLQAFTNAGLSYGRGKLFHYYVAKEVIFSVAPQAEPYYFDMDNISSFSTRGLNFIFDAYRTGYEDLAREVALQLADELQGDVRETLR
ncbi:MAG TPA: cell division protein ZipA C-terminal FtsZ-binding domain-containing protein [Gammaproteobacteria bacterium]|nr:cell division protein ZipA C-terminal FtsZ-binding domain-containing protein [Gammaproteobacteria bacterium]